MTIWRKRIACWETKATDTHSRYVILIDFPLQQWLQELAPVLHYMYTACLVNNIFPLELGYLNCSIQLKILDCTFNV